METEIKDPALWKVAKKRAGFKYQLVIYLTVTIFLWILWYVNLDSTTEAGQRFFPWPLWPMCGWGIGVFYSYIDAYRSNNKLAEKEYQKLTFKQ